MFLAKCVPITIVVIIIVAAPIKVYSGATENAQTPAQSQGKDGKSVHPNSLPPNLNNREAPNSNKVDEDPPTAGYPNAASNTNSINVLNPDVSIKTGNGAAMVAESEIKSAPAVPRSPSDDDASVKRDHQPHDARSEVRPVLTTTEKITVKLSESDNEPIVREKDIRPSTETPISKPRNPSPHTGSYGFNAGREKSYIPARSPIYSLPSLLLSNFDLIRSILNVSIYGQNYFRDFQDSFQQSIFAIINYNRIMSNPDIGASTIQLANKNGYGTETHEVVTEDGFILTHFRIVRRKQQWFNVFLRNSHDSGNIPPPKGTPVIVLLAGIFLNSDNWLLLGEHSLPILLVEAGYDVWLLNSRGHNYSKRHVHLSANDVAFWDHSWHEIGIYDLPASFDHILNATGNEKLTFIGYTAGTTAFFVLLSEKPEYNDKITAMVGYAPLAFWRHLRAINISPIVSPLFRNGIANRDIEILSVEGPRVNLLKQVCKQPVVFDFLCLPFLYSEYGWNNVEEERARAPEFLSHTTSFALKQLVHFGQCVDSKRFLKFKHLTPSLNAQEYGSQDPPDYNLQNVRIPVVLYYAELDPLSTEEDVLDLADILPNLVYAKKVPYKYFDYQSFTWGFHAPKLVYEPTLKFLRNINSGM